MYFLHAINSDHRQTRLLNVLGQIAMILGDIKKKNSIFPFVEHAMLLQGFLEKLIRVRFVITVS